MSDITLTSAMRQNLLSLQGTAKLMDMTQNRISTGLKVSSALDNPTSYFTAKGLSNSASDLATLKDSMGQGISAIESADKALTSITSLIEQMKGLTSSAQGSTSATERASLAAQFDGMRGQVDKLALDASYSGKNLVNGRGNITGGTFIDTAAAAETSLSGVSAGGIARTGTDTNLGDYAITVQQKVNNLNTSVTGTTDVSLDAGLTNASAVEFFVDGVSVGTATTAAEAGSAFATKISNLSADLTASVDGTTGFLTVTAAEGKSLEIRGTDAFFTDSGLTEGLQNDTTGAQVKDLTSDLGIYGAEIYASVSGYTDDATSSNVTFSVSGTNLTITDGASGNSTVVSTAIFGSAGTDVVAVGDLNVNFVTSTATENANAAPTVATGAVAQAQAGTLVIAGGTQVNQVDTATLSGTIEEGDTFKLTIGTEDYTYAATEADVKTANGNNATLTTAVRDALLTLANVGTGTHGVTVTTSGTDAFTLTGSSQASFTSSVTATDHGTDSPAVGIAYAAGTLGVAETAGTSTIQLSGNVQVGDTYSAVVDGTTYSHSVVVADITAGNNATSLATVATALAALINVNGNLSAAAATDTITLTHSADYTVTSVTATARATDATETFSVANTTAASKGYEAGDAFTVVVDGTSYVHTLAASSTAAEAGTAFLTEHKAAIEAAHNVTIANAATPNGTLTVTSDTIGDAFTLTSTISTNVGNTTTESITANATATQVNVAASATAQINSAVDDGDVYSITVNGTTVSYTATTTDTTAELVATGLKNVINNDATLSALLDDVTTDGSGQLTLTEAGNGASLSVSGSATDAAVSLGNGTGTSSTQALKNLTTGTVTGDTRIQVTSGGVTETADVNTDSTVAVSISNAAWGSTFSFTGDDASMVAGETATVSVTNPTGAGANDMKVTFNVDNTAFVNTTAVDASASGLAVNAAAGGWATTANIQTSIDQLTSAVTSLRSFEQALSTNLGIIQTREDYTSNFINVLQSGADKLTMADTNEEAANMLALQTRQQLGIQSLSMASQAAQSILGLFR